MDTNTRIERTRSSIRSKASKDVREAADLVDDESFRTTVIESVVPVLVLFTSRGCVPCDLQVRQLPSLADELRGVAKLVHCPAESAPRAFATCDVSVTPTLMLFDGGEPVDSHGGIWPVPAVRAWMDTLLSSEHAPRHSSPAARSPEWGGALLRAVARIRRSIRGTAPSR